ncbi:MAG TPA: hypothetical protein VIS29_05075 [Streptomyces sp.]
MEPDATVLFLEWHGPRATRSGSPGELVSHPGRPGRELCEGPEELLCGEVGADAECLEQNLRAEGPGTD